MKKTLVQIIESMKDYIRALYPRANLAEGSMISDINIVAPSIEIAKTYEQLERISLDQSIETASEDGLELWGDNLNLKRKSALGAIGRITFFSDIVPSGDISIAAGTIVSTRQTSGVTPIRFKTLRTITMLSALGNSYLNPDTGKYEVSTEIEAVNPGSSSNIGSQNITIIISPASGITGCYNVSPTSGGRDIESLENFRRRLALKWRGNALGTDNGYLSEIIANENVTDAVLVGHGESPREVIGAVDIYVKGSRAVQSVDIVPISNVISEYVFTKQPVLSENIQTIIYGGSGSVAPPTQSIIRDTAAYGGSIYGLDKVTWDGTIDSSNLSIFVVYSYNALIEDLQNLFSKTNKDVNNTNLLIKQAIEIKIDIDISIKVLTGFESIYVVFDIQDNLAEFFSNINIGEEVQQADVARIILNTPGVDDVLLPFNLFKSTDSTVLPNSFGNLDIPVDSYGSVNEIIVNVVV